MSNKSEFFISATLIVLVVSLLSVGCQEEGNPYPPGLFTQWIIDSIWVNPNPLRANLGNMVYARVKDSDGNLIPPNQVVYFETNVGSLGAGETSPTNGIASVSLDLTGVDPARDCTVTVRVVGLEEYTRSQKFDIVPSGWVGPKTIAMQLYRQAYAGTNDTAWVKVMVLDSNSAVMQNMEVGLKVLIGNVTLTRNLLNTDTIGYDTFGVLAPLSPQSVFIKAYWPVDSAIFGTLWVNFPFPQPDRFVIALSPDSILGCLGTQNATVNVSAFIGSQPAPDGATATICTRHGTLSPALGAKVVDNFFFPLSTSPDQCITLAVYNGTVSANLGPDGWAGWDTVYVFSGQSDTTFTFLRFYPGEPESLELYINRDTLLANGFDTTLILARLLDACGNRVRAGYTVAFNIGNPAYGSINPSTASTNQYGEARAILTSGFSTGSTDVGVSYGTLIKSKIVHFLGTTPARIILTATPDHLTANGSSQSLLTAQVLDDNGVGVSDGITIRFSTTGGYLSASSAQTSGGNASVNLRAPTVIGYATVVAWWEDVPGHPAVADTVVVYFDPGVVARLVLDPFRDTLTANGIDTTGIEISAVDSFGNPTQPSGLVRFSAIKGNVIPPELLVSGTDTVIYRAGTMGGTDVVSAMVVLGTGDTIRGSTTIRLVPTPPDTMWLQFSSSVEVADGSGFISVCARAMRTGGVPVSDSAIVYFNTTCSYLTQGSAYTVGGMACVNLAVPTAPCTARVSAVCEPETAYGTVIFVSGAPYRIELHISQQYDTVGSFTPDSIYGFVIDSLGNLVPSARISLRVLPNDSAGSLPDTVRYSDAGGYFSTLFFPGIRAGVAKITANSGVAVDTVDIVLRPEIANTEVITTDRNHIFVRGVGAIDQAILTAYIYDRYGNFVRDSTKVVFHITEHPGSTPSAMPELVPRNPDLGQLWSDTIFTIAGRGYVTVRAGESSGVVAVEGIICDGSGVRSGAPVITISSGVPQVISISAQKDSVWYSGNPVYNNYAWQLNLWGGWVINGLQYPVRVAVSDSFGNPIPNVSVHFTTDEGTIQNPDTVTDTSGVAYTYWYSSDPRVDGAVWLKACATAVVSYPVCDSLYFYLLDTLGIPPFDTVQQNLVYVVPDTIFGDLMATSEIMVRISRAGNPVPNYPVYFRADSGSIISPVFTDSIGYAKTTYYAGRNNHVSPPIITRDKIQVIAGVDTTYFNIYLLPVDPVIPYVSDILLYLSSANITIGDTVVVNGLVLDGRGYPVRLPVPVFLSLKLNGAPAPLEMGNIVPSLVYTRTSADSAGMFRTVFRSATRAGNPWIVARVSYAGETVYESLMVHIRGGSPDSIQLVSSHSFIEADGRSRTTITATVFDRYGNPVEGATVDFSTTLGTVNPTSVLTDASGIARTTLFSGNVAGTAIVQASCGGRIKTINVEFVPATVHFLILTATPNRIPADGVSTAQVNAKVLDQYGQPIADGTAVYFTCRNASGGTGTIDTIALTVNGEVNVILRAPTIAAQSYVIATSMGYVDSIPVEFVPGTPHHIVVDIEPETLYADSISQAIISVQVFDEYDNPVGRGQRVNFSTDRGTFLFDHNYTDASGRTEMAIISSRSVGEAHITVSCGSAEAMATMWFVPIHASVVHLTSDSLRMRCDGISRTTLHAIVLDSTGAAVPNGTPVRFTSSLGFVLPTISYTNGGEATSVLRATTTPGIATVVANAGGPADTLSIEFVPGDPGRIVMWSDSLSLPADGEATTAIHTVVYDAFGNRVGQGVQINFYATLGTVDSFVVTDSLGETVTYLRAGIVPGTSRVSAQSGTAYAQTFVDFYPSDVDHIYISANPTQLTADAYSTSTITGRVVNTMGNPISDGTPVRLAVVCEDTAGCLGYGEVMPARVYTDSGAFSATFVAGTRSGVVWVTATVGSLADSTRIRLIPGTPDSIALSITPSSIPADSFSTATLTARIFDQYGNPVGAGITVNFSTTMGQILPSSAVTNSSGMVTATIRSGRTTGIAIIRVESPPAVALGEILFTRMGGTLIVVTAEPTSIPADGVSSALIRAQVFDSLGNLVSDGTPVRFDEIYDTLLGPSGVIAPTIGFTSGGVATVRFIAGVKARNVIIRACTDSINCGQGLITLTPGQPDSVFVEPADTVISADGRSYTEVRAYVYDAFGNPVGAGVAVSFSTTLGTITPVTNTTNSQGSVLAILTSSTTPGVARIVVFSGGAFGTADVRYALAPPVYLSLMANPRRLTADGISTSTISARLINALGDPVVDGTMVIFHSTDNLGNSYGRIDTIGTTTNGTATVQLLAPTIAGVAYVSAAYRGTTDTLSDTVSVVFTPGAAAHVSVDANPETLYANDTITAEVRIIVLDQFGNLALVGQQVTINVENGIVIPSIGYTGDTIRCTYYPGDTAGRSTITATCGGIVGVKTIELLPQRVARMSVYADNSFLVADGISTTTIHVIAQDASGNPVADNTPIYLSSTAGLIFPGVTYTVSGESQATLRASTTAPETAWVTAVAGTLLVRTSVVFIPGNPALIEVVPDRTTLFADGEDTVTVRAYIKDIHGNWVQQGLVANFSTTLGSITNMDVTHGNADTTGFASARFRAGITAGTAIITVTCGSATGTGRVDLVPTEIGEVDIFANPDRIVANGHSTSQITGFVRNTAGNPVTDGTPVRLSVFPDSLGDISPVTVYTDSGQFSATFTARTYVDSVWIIMTVGTARDSVAIWLKPGPPYNILMNPVLGIIPADSASVDTIGVVVFDRYWNRVEGGWNVSFTTSLGEVIPIQNETDAAGSTYVHLRSGYRMGVARVVGRADSARGECSVVFTTTSPTVVSLSANPFTLTADGYSTSQLSATVLDTFGHLIADGTPVLFQVSSSVYGVVIPGVAYTSSGVATTSFRAGYQKGRPTITAMTDTLHFDQIVLNLTAGPPARIVLTVSDDTISANGMDQCQINAVVYDQWNNPVDAGLTVTFTSSLGQILIPTIQTDNNGQASAILQAGNVPGTSRVLVSCGSAYAVVDVVFRKSGVNTIILSANPVSLVADGVSNSVLTAQVFDANGSPVTDNTKVWFWINPLLGGTVISPKFTSGGQAVTNFIVGTDVGSGFVWVYAGDTLPPATTIIDSVRIALRPGEPAYVNITLDPTHTPPNTLYADGNDGMWVSAQVFDAYGNAIRGGTQVSFSTSLGRFEPTTSMTDTSGTARAFIRSGLTTGTSTITATCGNAIGFSGVEMIRTPVAGLILTAHKNRLKADGEDSTMITAYVFAPGGTVVSDNSIVHFFVDSPYVHILPENVFTDSGTASTTIRSDTIAFASIRVCAYATSGADTSDTACISFILDPGDPARMVISPTVADNESIPADGSSGIIIDVWVYDRYSNPVRGGSTVRFASTLGTITDVSFTDMSGHSSALLTSGTTVGNAVISITCGDITGFTQVKFYRLTAEELTMTINPVILTANGTSQANISVFVRDSSGFPVSDGTRVVFTQEATGGFVRGVISPHVAYTSAGQVTSTLTAPATAGFGRIMAYVDVIGSAVGDTFDVQYLAGPPAVIIFDTVGFQNFMADGRHYLVPARVTDAFGNPVRVGTTVNFSTSVGTITSPVVVATDTGGVFTYISSTVTGPGVITATSGDAVGAVSCYFQQVQGDWIMLIANPFIITADGVSQSVITATVMDTGGGIFTPVSDGVPVQFSIDGPGFLSNSVAFTSSGRAVVTLTAGTRADTVKVVAIGPGGIRDSVFVYLQPGPPAILQFVSSYIHNMLANGSDTMMVWVSIIDEFGNPVKMGTPVTFSTNLGSITPNSATNDSGYAWAILTASNTPGIATLSATCQSAVGYATLAMQALVADSIILVVYPRQIVADASSTSNLTAVVFDSTGMPVSDGTVVKFSTTRGITVPAVTVTSGGTGTATSQLVAAVSPDTVVVTAISGTVADTDTVILIPGPPAVMRIWTSPDSVLVANGNDTLQVWVEVADQYGNPVQAGLLVNFTSTIGLIAGSAYTDNSGRAHVLLSSTYEIGWALVSASSGSASANMLVQFVPESVGQVILSVNPIQLEANGSATASVSVTVLDVDGHPIADGTPILFTGLEKAVVAPPVVTTSSGAASATLSAFTIVGRDTLFASCGGKRDSVALTFVPGPPANIILTPNARSLISDGSDTTTVVGIVYDAAGNFVRDGTVVNFSVVPAEMGVVWSIAVTADTGRCATRFQSGTQPGMVSVQATSGSASGACIIELVPPGLSFIELAVESYFMPGDGSSRTTVTAMVFDSIGLPAPNGTGVHFAFVETTGLINGTLYPAWDQTEDGVATVQLIAPPMVGMCGVYAYIDTGAGYLYSDTEYVTFEGGEPALIRFIPSRVALTADGSESRTCTLQVLDNYSSALPNQPVNVTLDIGTVTPPLVMTDSLGNGEFTITAPRRIGSGVLQATTGSVTGYMNVQYIATLADTMFLYANPRGLPADGVSQSQIRAVVLDSLGRPVSDGIYVYFSTTAGFITPMDTTSNGEAEAVLVSADTIDTAQVRAICQSETAYVQVTFSAGPAEEIELSVSQPVDTVGSATIDSVYGFVFDAMHNPVALGTIVELTLSDPLLGSLGDTLLYTDGSGRFHTTFTPGLKSGLAWLTATSNGKTANVSIKLMPQIAHTESIDVDRFHIYVRGTGLIDQAVLVANIYDRYNNPIRDSTKVIFWFVNYPGGDSLHWPSFEPRLPSSQLYSDTVYTLGGRASVTVRSGKSSGVVLVRSAVLDGSGVISDAPRISISSGLPYNISVSSDSCNVRGWLMDGYRNGIKVIVSDSMNNPVPMAAVYFTTDEGMVVGSAITDSSGFAYSTWYSADPRDDGDVWVVARTKGDSSASCGGLPGWVCDSVFFYNSGPAVSMTITPTGSSVNADGTSTLTMTVTLRDINNNPVPDGTSIELRANLGTITSPVSTGGECVSSFALATYTSATLDIDNYCANPQVAQDVVSGVSEWSSATATVNLVGGNCSSSNSTIEAPSNVPAGGPFVVVVVIKDIWGNPICGQSVRLTSAVGASITSSNPTSTDNAGNASFNVTAVIDTVDVNDVLTASFSSCAVWKDITYRGARLMKAAVPYSSELNYFQKSEIILPDTTRSYNRD